MASPTMTDDLPPVSSSRLAAPPKSISSLSPLSTATTLTNSSPGGASLSSFGGPKSSISRKKPMGLDISKSIPKPSRAAPGLPGDKGGSGSGSGGMRMGMTEHERLREDIAKLQLSSRSSSSSASVVESPTSPTYPLHASDSSSSSVPKRTKGKKSKTDSGGHDLVKDEDLEVLRDLGAGNGGTVTKVWNKKRKCVMARKLILVDAKPSVRKQILRELQIMSDCSSPYIVDYYGCFPVDVHVGLVIEYMDAGSLDQIYRRNGSVPIDLVGKVAEAVLRGLVYLYDVHRIIHRDIKPSNILANTKGEIKICDFGVSGELINSIANTFVGTSTYMSPERIQGAPYTIKSDLWSLGISLIELALGRFPFSDPPDSSDDEDEEEVDPDPTLPLSTARPHIEKGASSKKKKSGDRGVSLGGGGHTMSILELLHYIVNEPAPRLISRKREFPASAVSFIEGCLDKDPTTRKSTQELLTSEWIVNSKVTIEELQVWAKNAALPVD